MKVNKHTSVKVSLKIKKRIWNKRVQVSEATRVRPIPCRRPILNTIGCSYTDTDTELYKLFVLKMQFRPGYRCVQVIYVCGVYARK